MFPANNVSWGSGWRGQERPTGQGVLHFTGKPRPKQKAIPSRGQQHGKGSGMGHARGLPPTGGNACLGGGTAGRGRLSLANRAAQPVEGFRGQRKSGVAPVSNEELWKVLEEEATVLRPTSGVFLTRARVASRVVCMPVPCYRHDPESGVCLTHLHSPGPPTRVASEALNIAVGSSPDGTSSSNFVPSSCLGIHFSFQKWGQ